MTPALDDIAAEALGPWLISQTDRSGWISDPEAVNDAERIWLRS